MNIIYILGFTKTRRQPRMSLDNTKCNKKRCLESVVSLNKDPFVDDGENLQNANSALYKALEGPLLSVFGVADYEVFDNDIDKWLAQGSFSTNLTPDKMEQITLCFITLAQVRRSQESNP